MPRISPSLVLVLSLLCACTESSSDIPVPKAKPSTSDTDSQEKFRARSFADAIGHINEARIHLAGDQAQRARPLLKEAQDIGYHLAFDEQGAARSVAGELTFSREGMRSRLYLPVEQNQLEQALSQLARYQIEPVEFRLISFPRSVSPIPFGERVAAANKLLEKKQPDASDLRAADRELEYIYVSCKATELTGQPQLRVRHYLKASSLFAKRGEYKLAREALDHAEAALADLRLEDGNEAPTLARYEREIAQADATLQAKNPSLLSRMGNKFDGLVETLLEE